MSTTENRKEGEMQEENKFWSNNEDMKISSEDMEQKVITSGGWWDTNWYKHFGKYFGMKHAKWKANMCLIHILATPPPAYILEKFSGTYTRRYIFKKCLKAALSSIETWKKKTNIHQQYNE